MNLPIALIHSPLVGPFTWSMVADELRALGIDAYVPDLANPTEGPFWEQHARSAAAQLAEIEANARIVLAGHSGAGPLLPAIARELKRQVVAYVFVDAGLPRAGKPRNEGQFGELLRDLYSRGERFPNWTDESLAGTLPDPGIRGRVLADLRPQPFEYWAEPLPEVAGWPDGPCAYLRFSPAYHEDAREAGEAGWPVHELDGGHFHMLVEPGVVTGELLDLLQQMGVYSVDD